MILIERYTSEAHAEWDNLVAGARNGTFLHRRDFMEYHSDRFDDCSLLARNGETGKLLCVMPACKKGDTLSSHSGLTYGGWLLPASGIDAPTLLEVFDKMIDFARQKAINKIIYKPVPYIYHTYPCDEELYALFRYSAKQVAANLSAAIDLSNPIAFDRGNRHNLNVAQRHGIKIAESDDWCSFWHILTAVLNERHNLSPVHSLPEIELLHSRFPDSIKLWTATLDGETVAGTVVFNTATVAHAQYIASSSKGRETKALSALFNHVIAVAQSEGKRFFDFGVSTEADGTYLNEGLNAQKWRFGARGVIYPIYEIEVSR